MGKFIDLRIEALKRFAVAITVLNIAGHAFLGFEQSWAHPVAALMTAYALELSFEWLHCKLYGLRPRYKGGVKKFILFLLPAHISGMAVSMLLFSNERIVPIVFATAVAILSKILFRVKVNGHSRHFLNPSNSGIALTLILFPWIGIAPPYQFTENTSGIVDWLLPLVFICVGSFLNTKFTKKMPLILAWFAGFISQALIRSLILEAPVLAALNPMTGVAFLLFSFYMISDPATTPNSLKNQILFGSSIALCYSLLVCLHVVFGQFFALLIVCSMRGFYLWITGFVVKPALKREGALPDLPLQTTEPYLNAQTKAG